MLVLSLQLRSGIGQPDLPQLALAVGKMKCSFCDPWSLWLWWLLELSLLSGVETALERSPTVLHIPDRDVVM